jgi:hypothetical protein
VLLSEAKFILRAVGSAVTAALVLPFVLVAWLMMSDGVSLGFLAPYVREGLARQDLPYAVDFEDTVLAWDSENRTLDIRIRDVRIAESGKVFRIPEIGVDVSLAALLDGLVAPTRIEVRGIALEFRRDADGTFALAMFEGRSKPDAEASGAAQGWIEELLKSPDRAKPSGYLRELRVRDVSMVIDDRATGQVWRMPNAAVTLTRDEIGIVGTYRVELEEKGARVPIEGEASYNVTSRRFEMRARFLSVSLPLFVDRVPDWVHLEALDFPVSGVLRFGFDADGKTSPVAFEFRGGPGRLVLPTQFKDPVALRSVEVGGEASADFERLDLKTLRIETHGPTIEGNAAVLRKTNGADVRALASFREFRANDIDRYWPLGLAVDARDWVVANIRDGVVTDGRFALRLQPGDFDRPRLPQGAIDFTFAFSGVSAEYLRPMPRLTKARGRARVTESHFELSLGDGLIEPFGLVVADGTMRIGEFGQTPKFAVFDFAVSGGAANALALADHEPLGLISGLGIDPGKIGGTAKTRVRLRFPIKDYLGMSEIEVRAKVEVENGSVPGAFAGLDVSDAKIAIEVDNAQLVAAGDVKLGGAPLRVEWQEYFKSKDGITSRYHIVGTVDDAARRTFGLNFDPYLSGRLGAEVVFLARGELLDTAEIKIDLTNAAVDLPVPRWAKKAGVPGKGSIYVEVRDDGAMRIGGFKIESAGFLLEGSGEVEADRTLRRVSVDRFVQGDTDVSASAEHVSQQGWNLRLAGPSLDLRPYLKDILASDDDAPLPSLDLDVRIDRIIVGPHLPIRELDARAIYRADKWRSIHAQGKIGQAPLKIDLDFALSPGTGRPNPAARRLEVISADAGALGRALDLYDNVRSGRLTLDAVIDDGAAHQLVNGQLVIENFYLVDTPILARVLAAGSLTGMVNLLSGEGINFARFEVPFSMTETRIRMEGAGGAGSALGITLEGVVDRKNDTVDLRGTISPAYTLNSLLSNIPVIGGLFTARPGEGIIGINYSVKGPMAEPDVGVNFLSVLTPGFLRRITNIFTPNPVSPPRTGPADPDAGRVAPPR